MADAQIESNISIKRKRIHFRCWHRGTREMDFLLGRFADAALAEMSEGELDDFEAFLNNSDPDIYNWVSGQEIPPEEDQTEMLAKISAYYKTAR